MNIMLIGNGFDIHYKLPTKYQNFLHVVDFLQNYYDDSMTTVGAVLGDERLHEQDKFIEDSYSTYGNIYDQTKLDSKEIHHLITLANSNIWYSYLLSTYNQDIGWIDFEKEISVVCSCFQILFESDSIKYDTSKNELKIFFKSAFKSDADRYIVSRKFNFFFEGSSYKGVFSSGLTGEDDGGMPAFGNVKKDYFLNIPFGSNNIVLDIDKVVATLSEQLESLAEMLKIYLRCFVENVCDKLVDNEIIHPLGLNIDHVITFNYTKTYEKLDSLADVIHIHGCTDDNLVLGINPDHNDDLESVDTTFISFKKYFQRTLFRTDLPYLDFIREVNQANKSVGREFRSLYVLGHSLDITDADVIKDLFLSSDIITILCHSNNAVRSYIPNLIKIFGKETFDKLRLEKQLRFRLTATELNDVINEQLDYSSRCFIRC